MISETISPMRTMVCSFLVWEIVIMAFLLQSDNFVTSELCAFNPLCTCRKSHHEVSCRGVPFFSFPSMQSYMENAYQVTITRSGLKVLEEDCFIGTSVASLHLMNNDLKLLFPGAFHGLESLLTTLDLSHNKLQEIPLDALRHLCQLRWLNLHANEISVVLASKLGHLGSKSNIQSLFLGSNHITVIPDVAFSKLINLNILDLGDNVIHDLGSRPFPTSIKTLTLSNNPLGKVPLHALYHLKNLRWLHLSGNLLEELPTPFLLQTAWLEKLDLSNNLLKTLPRGVFNDTLIVRELNFGFNFLRTLPRRAFRGTQLERLLLANNRISSMHSDAMMGIENALSVLDLSFNLMDEIPTAIGSLKALLHLSLRSNLLRNLDEKDLFGCRNTLEILDLSGNKLKHVPKKALKSFDRIVRLSLQDNRIDKMYRDDFEGWGGSLSTLSLANNGMTFLSGGTFLHTPKLRELKLSFNNLMYLDQHVFAPVRKTLEVLELSAALSEYNHPPEVFLHEMERLEWLQLDHNNISHLQDECLFSLKRLLHLDVEGNDLTAFPERLFDSQTHPRLSTVHASNNRLEAIHSKTFSDLRHISNIVFYNNELSIIESEAFVDCSFLNTLVLSSNRITSIEKGALFNLTRLTNLFFQNNLLEKFSLDTIVGDTGYLYLNLSNNILKTLAVSENENNTFFSSAKVRTLDLTNNKLLSIPLTFMEAVSVELVYLFLSRNSISDIFFPHLPRLQSLHLSCNNINELNESILECCPFLQYLNVDHNHISTLSDRAFTKLKYLRFVDLSFNNIHSVSENIFVGSKLESLNLSHNALSVPPYQGLVPVAISLRYLDLSGNHIVSLDATGFEFLSSLQALNMSSNEISSLHDQCFLGLHLLLELDLSHNPLQGHVDEIPLMSLKWLRYLSLRNVSLSSLPILPLTHLVDLDVSSNSISNISSRSLQYVNKLRILDLSTNSIKALSPHMWKYVPNLAMLDISHNPIEILSMSSLDGLSLLRHLGMRSLPFRRLDPRALHGLRFLTTLETNSYHLVRSFRLQDLLSRSPAVRSVTICVEESTLSHQLQGAFGTNLRELTVTGRNLKWILPDAFSGMSSTHELMLKIVDTSVERLPDGLLRYLPDVRYLTLDVRGNRLLTSMRPQVLAPAAGMDVNVQQTHHITGGVLLEDNPWNCSCNLLWLGKWLRRWLRETFQMHLLSIEAALYVNTVTRKATCTTTIPISNNSTSTAIYTRPLIDLKPSNFGCTADINHASNKPRICLSTIFSTHIFTLGFVMNLMEF